MGCGWPDGAVDEAAAAVGADIVQVLVNAVRAEGALIGADHRIQSLGWQVFVAIFAVGPKFEHGQIFV